MPKFTLICPKLEETFHKSRKYTIPTGAGVDDTTTIKVPVLEDGSLELVLCWRKKFEELCQIKSLNAQSKFVNALLLLGGPAKEKLLAAKEEILGAGTPTETRFRETMNSFISKCGATSNTAEDLREFLMNVKKPSNMKFADFKSRIVELDYYLQYLPGPLNDRLGEAVLFSTLKKSVPSWRQKFINANVRTSVETISDLTDYYESLEEEEERQARQQNRRHHQRNENRSRNQPQTRQQTERYRTDRDRRGNQRNSGEYRHTSARRNKNNYNNNRNNEQGLEHQSSGSA